MDYSENRFYRALEKRYSSNIEEAVANAENIFENPVAIGDHSDLVGELQKYIEVISKNYEDQETLKTYFGDGGQ